MNGPVRIIEGDAKPYEAFWRFVDAAKSESGETEIEFFGPISEYSWYGDEITPKLFKDELSSKGKGGPVTIKVHSPGGEVFAATAIRSILQDYPGKVTADIIGIAASAATVVVTGADLVKMRDTAMFMIHDPSTIAWGTLDEMRQVVTVLEQAKETIVTAYEKKTGMKRDDLAQLMTSETWMTAEQAKSYGFVDEIVTGEKAKAKAPKNMRAAFLNCLKSYENAPKDLQDEVLPEEADTSEAAETESKPVLLSEEQEELRNHVRIILGKEDQQ
jgi:ATP-dependent Clp protease, protease subunit